MIRNDHSKIKFSFPNFISWEKNWVSDFLAEFHIRIRLIIVAHIIQFLDDFGEIQRFYDLASNFSPIETGH